MVWSGLLDLKRSHKLKKKRKENLLIILVCLTVTRSLKNFDDLHPVSSGEGIRQV